MNNQVGVVVAEVMDRQDNVTVTHLPSMIRVDCRRPYGLRLRRVDNEASARKRASTTPPSSRRTCPPTTGKMVHMDDRTMMFGNLEDAAEFIGDMLPPPSSK